MSSLGCKTRFYKPKHKPKGGLMELSFEGLEIPKWNVPTDIVQIVDEQSGVICLVTMFTQEDLSVAFKFFDQAVINCLLSSAKRTKRTMFYILKTITLEVNLIFTIFKHFNPIFFMYSLSGDLSHLCIPTTSKLHF